MADHRIGKLLAASLAVAAPAAYLWAAPDFATTARHKGKAYEKQATPAESARLKDADSSAASFHDLGTAGWAARCGGEIYLIRDPAPAAAMRSANHDMAKSVIQNIKARMASICPSGGSVGTAPPAGDSAVVRLESVPARPVAAGPKGPKRLYRLGGERWAFLCVSGTAARFEGPEAAAEAAATRLCGEGEAVKITATPVDAAATR